MLQIRPGVSWIDFWSDTKAFPKYKMRAHLGNQQLDSVYHPNELSITSWGFPHWRTYKQMQWMILSVGAIDYLRTDHMVLNCMLLVTF